MLGYDRTERPGSGATAVLLHPHPDMGGDRYHPAVQALYDGLPISTLRFSFTSSSPPVARAEALQAIELAADPAVVLVGYSFGADIALSIGDERILGWFAVAPPLSIGDPATFAAAADPRPKRLSVPEHDQFSPPGRATALTADWRATTVEILAGSDHFLVGHTAAVVDAVTAWLPSVFGAG